MSDIEDEIKGELPGFEATYKHVDKEFELIASLAGNEGELQ